jgi:hypothetical protein
MAKIYSSPTGIGLGRLKFDGIDKYEDRLRDYVKEASPSKSPLVGTVVRQSVADGQASYMVFSTSPLALVHVEYGDAYRGHPFYEKGITVKGIKAEAKFNKAMFDLGKTGAAA